MKLYCHINEFEAGKLSVLQQMLLLGKNVALSSPSGAFLESARGRGFALELRDLLNLVEHGTVQVAGRQEWFRKDLRDKHPWPPARHWLPEFDSAIAAMAVADRDLPATRARVFTLEPEAGLKIAEREAGKRGEIFRKAEALERGDIVPTGTREKFSRARSRTDRIKMIMRDAYNHEKARRDLGCDLAIEPEVEGGAMVSLFRAKRDSGTPMSDVKKLRDLLKALSELRPIKSFADLQTAMDEVKPFRHEFDHYLQSDAPLHAEIRAEILAGLKFQKISRAELIGALGGTAVSVLSCALVAKDLLQPHFDGSTILVNGALALLGGAFGLPSMPGAAKTLSLLPADYDGDRVWFALANGSANPTLNEIDALLKTVDSLA